MATATEVISALQGCGVTLKADGAGGLRVTGISRLSDREKATLKHHKPAILKALADSLSNPTTTTSQAPVAGCSTAVVVPPARECRNCVHWQQYPYEAPLGNCHALKRMQHASSRPRKFGCGHFQPTTGQQEVRP